MPNEQQQIAKARLFAALDLPGPVAAQLEAWGDRELTDEWLRRVPRENLHMTLCFLGWTEEPLIGAVAEAIGSLEPVVVPISFEAMPLARPPRRPALFAIGVRSAAASQLQTKLSRTLAALGVYKPEQRPFWPHVTVARVHKMPGGAKRPRPINRPPGELPEALTEPFGAVRVRLYRSTIRPDGAVYAPLANLDLPPLA